VTTPTTTQRISRFFQEREPANKQSHHPSIPAFIHPHEDISGHSPELDSVAPLPVGVPVTTADAPARKREDVVVIAVGVVAISVEDGEDDEGGPGQ
jgi:hypothetical protein